MKIELLTISEVADLIEQAYLSNRVISQQQTQNEVIYRIQYGRGERLLINTPCSSYLITESNLKATPLLSATLNHQQAQSLKLC